MFMKRWLKSVMCLLYKYEIQGSDPQCPCKKLSLMVCAYNTSVGGGWWWWWCRNKCITAVWWLASKPNWIHKLQVLVRDLVSKGTEQSRQTSGESLWPPDQCVYTWVWTHASPWAWSACLWKLHSGGWGMGSVQVRNWLGLLRMH